MTTEHVSVPRDDYNALVALSRCTLHIAYVWNDHNYGPVKRIAKSDAIDVGIRTLEEANEFIDKLIILSRTTPMECLSELMRGLEIPPAAAANMQPHGFYAIGRAIAEQAKQAGKTSAPRVVTDELVQLVADDLDGIFAIEDIQEPAFLTDVRRIVQRIADELATSLPAARVPDVKAMVERFLGWRLPKDFAPDGGVSFERHYTTLIDGRVEKKEREPNSPWWPVGTNLLTADQAEQMFRYMLAAAPQAGETK